MIVNAQQQKIVTAKIRLFFSIVPIKRNVLLIFFINKPCKVFKTLQGL